MIKRLPISAAELRGIAQLATHASLGVTDIAEALHHTITSPWTLFSKKPDRRMGGVPGLIYKTIRVGTRAVGGSATLGLRAIQGKSDVVVQSEAKLALISALNGVVGDHLVATNNPLAIPMQWRVGDTAAKKSGKLIILIHGLCMNDQQWLRDGHDHGAALSLATGATPLYIRYNTGLPIAENGKQFSRLLTALVAQWPVAVTQIAIVAHSMGGLVTRAALNDSDATWRSKLKQIVFLGTPHAGAPLERGGHWVDLLLKAIPYSAPFVRLTTLRSAGITDLREGNTTSPLPTDVTCYAIAGSLSATPGAAKERFLGDGLVPLTSALGETALKFAKRNTWVAQGVGHLDLLSDTGVAAKLIAWFAPTKRKATLARSA